MQAHSNIETQLADENLQAIAVQQQCFDQGVSFTEVHAQLPPVGGNDEQEGPVQVGVGEGLEEQEDKKEVAEEAVEKLPAVERNLSLVSESDSKKYALSCTVLHEGQKVAEEEKGMGMKMEVVEDL